MLPTRQVIGKHRILEDGEISCEMPVHMIFLLFLGCNSGNSVNVTPGNPVVRFQSSQGKFHVKCQLPMQITGISHDKSFVYIEKRGKTRASGKFHVKCQLSIQVTGISHEISPQHDFLSVLVARGKFMWRGKMM